MTKRLLLFAAVLALVFLSGCVTPAAQRLGSDLECLLSLSEEEPVSEPSKDVSASNEATTEVRVTARVGSYIPVTAKEEYYLAGPMAGAALRIEKGWLKHCEFALDICHSQSKQDRLETLQGYLTGETFLLLLHGDYVVPLMRSNGPISMQLLGGGGVVAESVETNTKYFNPAIGWVNERETDISWNLLLHASLRCLWQVSEKNEIEFQVGLIGYPLSDNVTGACFCSVGFRF